MKHMSTLMMIAISLALGACSSYRGEAIEGWVVDAETQRPLEGVIVVVHWPLEGGGHPGIKTRLFAKETVTDRAGHYGFPAWGPLRPAKGYLSGSAPYLAFFKPDYEPFGSYEHDFPGRDVPRVRSSVLSGKTVKLKPHQGDFEEYTRTIDIQTQLFLTSFGVCDWELFPQMTAQLVKLGEQCASRRMLCGMPTREELRGNQSQRCSDPDEILKGL